MRLNYWTTNNFFEILKNNLWSNNFCQEIQKNVWNWCCIISCRVYSEWTWVLPCNLNWLCLLFKVFTLIEIPWYFTKTQMILKQCSITNFLSAEVSTLLKCVITHYSSIRFHICDRTSNWIYLGLFLIKALMPLSPNSCLKTSLNVAQMVTFCGDATFLIVPWFQTGYMKDLPKYCSAE